MEGYLRKYGRLLQLLFVIMIAAMLAVITSEVVGIYLAPYRVPNVDLTSKKVEDRALAPTSEVSAEVMARVINDRCLFDGCPEKEAPKTCQPACQEDEICNNGVCVKNPEAQPETLAADVPVESNSGIKLLGVIVASNPRYSTAIIKTPTAKVSNIVSVGDSVNGAEIKEIYRDRLIFSRNGRLEFIRLDESLQGNPSPGRTLDVAAAKKPTPPPPPSPPSVPERMMLEAAPETLDFGELTERGAGIKAPKLSNVVELDRKEINRALKNPAALAKDATVLPHYENGRPAGVKLNGVGGVFATLGIRSGDVIKRVNGQKITSQVSAFQAFSKLKNSKTIGIEVDRGGKTETLNYTIK